MNRICLACQRRFKTKPSRVKIGKGKYCSRKCWYSSIKFKNWTINPLFSKAKAENAKKTGKLNRGRIAWNRGIPRPQYVKDAISKANWKGDKVGYAGLHKWVNEKLGKAKLCGHCGSTNLDKHYEWANKSHVYKRNLDDWIQLCQSCHKKYDKGFEGAINKRYA